MDKDSSEITALLDKAQRARGQTRYAEAREHLLSAVEIARRMSHGKSELLAGSLNDLARIERDLNHTDASISGYMELYHLQKKQNRPLGMAHALRHLADIFREEKRKEDADANYREAIRISRQHGMGEEPALANALRGYALLMADIGKDTESQQSWEEAKQIYDKHKIRSGVQECDLWIERLTR